ncbi:MAG: hypothetical protein ACYSUV_01910 [Planctomycetota bacterium]|jgi:hypothetical protein
MKLFEHHYQEFVRNAPSIIGATPVDIAEIADWYYKEAEIPVIDVREQLPTLISPWQSAIYEYKFPPYYHCYDESNTWVDIPFTGMAGKSMCCLLIQERVEQGYIPASRDEQEALRNISRRYPGEVMSFRQTLLLFVGDKTNLNPLARVTMLLNEDGRALEMGIRSLTEMEGKNFHDAARNMVYPIYFAINLMHCRNVRTADTEVPVKLAKKRAKAGRATLAWKKIIIDPMRKKVTEAQKSGKGNSVSLALRIARGHWKDYTKGRGLFGKLKGRYWWDDVADGTLGREYSVKKPENVEI